MIVWMFVLGIAEIVVGMWILLNHEQALRWCQKQPRQNVGEVGKAFADAADEKPNAMVGPGIGAIGIGVSVIFQSLNR